MNPERLAVTYPAGLYLRGLRVGVSVDSVRRLYETLSSISPTLPVTPTEFYREAVSHRISGCNAPIFGSRSVVASVLRELGASDAAAALPTSDGQIVVRRAREVEDLSEEEGFGPS